MVDSRKQEVSETFSRVVVCGSLVAVIVAVAQLSLLGAKINAVLLAKLQKVIALDRIFSDNDQLKTTTVLQFSDAGVKFKSI